MYGMPRSPKWTPEQDALLVEAVGKKTSLQRLVVRFGKPAGAIRSRAKELGLEITKLARAPKENTKPKSRWAASKPRR
jgi:hypothetical protein